MSVGSRLVVLASCMTVVLSAGAARAEDAPKSWFQQITLNAFVSASYQWNFNDPLSKITGLGPSQPRAFDYDHNSFRIDAAEVVIQKAVANKGDFGFRLDVAFGAVARL